ncbi:MAG: 5'-nucleotidase C-terminal domain-containing protein, partial [Phascolarctobacterium sp.]
MKRLLLFLLVCIVMLTSACGGKKEQQQKPITVYLWSVELLREYAPYIQAQLPDVDIHFVVGNNDLNYYKFLNEKGQLPDIITCRRFALHDAVELKEQLLNLAKTEAAASIYLGYLENYKYPDGTINWLPVCGEAENLVANKALFAKYGIPLPHDYQSLKNACDKFAALGIKPFVSDWYYDYTPLALLQGFAAHELSSRDGQLWRMAYENTGEKKGVGLDKKVWPVAFKRMESFIRDAHVVPQDDAMNYVAMDELFVAGKAAMTRLTGNVALEHIERYGMNLVMLPYFGQDGGMDWLLTYPAFQVALNKNLAKDELRQRNALRVLNVMLSEGAQKTIGSRNDVISYSRNAKLNISPLLEDIKPLIESNRLYVRLASTDFFAASKLAVSKLVKGEATAEQAYKIMDEYLQQPKDKEVAKLHPFNKAYSFACDKHKGNAVNSAMVNTLRAIYGSDVVIAAGYSFTSPIMNTDYSERMLQYMIMPNNLESFSREMSGEQLEQVLRLYVEGVPNVDVYSTVRPVNYHNLPITSGLEYTVQQGKKPGAFKLEQVLVKGKPLDKQKHYRVTILDKHTFFKAVAKAADAGQGAQAFARGKQIVRKDWLAYFKAGKNLQQPTSYVQIVD